MANRRGADGDGRAGGPPRNNDPLMREVRWRLFRREDMPARLRRLERMEKAAFSEPPEERPPDGDGGQTAG